MTPARSSCYTLVLVKCINLVSHQGICTADTADRIATEERFLDAAERLLIEVGYANISTRRLAEEAGVNHGLVHYYFGSMEHLFLRVLERFTERLIARQRDMYAADLPFIEKWRAHDRTGYDLIAYFDCLHDMGDPTHSIRHTRDALAADGTVLLVEPAAGMHVEDNFNPVGQFYSGASVLVCTPNALATGTDALGTVATDDALGDVVRNGGLSRFRRVLQTPLNRVFEARL